ncbi:unnamed protein product [Pneumocystis jirovecii]|nr:unnamed protein product [Pneumocystis jirovecii]
MTKQAYHNGTVIIQCPQCKNYHLISDHLKIFSDKNITIEDIMKEKGEEVRRFYGDFTDNQSVEFMNDNIQFFLSRPKNE